MRGLWNLLAVVGLITVIAIGYFLPSGVKAFARLSDFDPGAWQTYRTMMANILETGNAAEATVWKAKVADGIAFEDLDQSIKFIANANNIKNVGELPLSGQVEAMTGKPFRTVKIYMFCNALTAANMLQYSDAYAAYLPCRISVVEDKSGALWIYTLNMDPMIYGGLPLPPALKTEAEGVKKIMQDILQRGAKGDF